MYYFQKTIYFTLFVILFVFSCARPEGSTVQEKRDSILTMKEQTLAELYRENPETKNKIRYAPGYAVFSNIGTGLLILGTGRGYGVAVDNATGKNTYMRMAEVGVGLGVQFEKFREVIIFNDKIDFYQFIEKGWDFGGEAGAAAKSEEEGEAYGGAASFEPDVETYQITDKGVALRASVSGSKFWKDDELN